MILQRSITDDPMFPEGVVVIVAADEATEGDFTAHYFDSRAVSRLLHMSFRDGVWVHDFDVRYTRVEPAVGILRSAELC